MYIHNLREFRQSQPNLTATDDAVANFISQASLGATTFYPANAVIYAEGDVAGPLYFVEFGTVRVCRVASNGRRQIAAFYSSGEIFGFEPDELHLFYAESVDGAGVRAVRPNRTESGAEELLHVALRGLISVQTQMMLAARMSANERLAVFLLDLKRRQGAEDFVALQMQRQDIGDYLGLTFETVSRTFRALKDNGIIELPTPDRVRIIDLRALAQLAAAED